MKKSDRLSRPIGLVVSGIRRDGDVTVGGASRRVGEGRMTDDRGEMVRGIEAMYGDVHVLGEFAFVSDGDKPPVGEKPSLGDLRSWPLRDMLVPAMLVALRVRFEQYDPARTDDDIGDTASCGWLLSRGAGEPREAPSRRRRCSLEVIVYRGGGSSPPGGEEARRFWPDGRAVGVSMWKSRSRASSIVKLVSSSIMSPPPTSSVADPLLARCVREPGDRSKSPSSLGDR